MCVWGSMLLGVCIVCVLRCAWHVLLSVRCALCARDVRACVVRARRACAARFWCALRAWCVLRRVRVVRLCVAGCPYMCCVLVARVVVCALRVLRVRRAWGARARGVRCGVRRERVVRCVRARRACRSRVARVLCAVCVLRVRCVWRVCARCG